MQSFTLDNGLTVDVVEYRTLPVVCFQLVLSAADVGTEERAAGLLRSTMLMLQEGTATRSSEGIADAVDRIGGELDIDLDADCSTLRLNVLREDADKALALLAEMVKSSTFPEPDLARLRRQEIDRLEIYASDPGWLAGLVFYGELYGDHPYGVHDVSPDAIESLQRDQLAAFHAKHVVADRATLVVVGDVTLDSVRSMIEGQFGGWAAAGAPRRTPPEPTRRSAREIVLVNRPGSVQSEIWLGDLAVRRSDPDFIALRIASQVLGGTAASRLLLDLREKRSLTYAAFCELERRADVAPFRAYTAVRNEVTGQAVGALYQNVERWCREAPSGEELENAKSYIMGSFPRRMETTTEIASLTTALRIQGLSRDYWDGYCQKVAAIGPEESLEAARKYVDAERALLVVVGDADVVQAQLAGHGPVQIIELEGEEGE